MLLAPIPDIFHPTVTQPDNSVYLNTWWFLNWFKTSGDLISMRRTFKCLWYRHNSCLGRKVPKPIMSDMKSQHSPTVSGGGAAFLLQYHPDLFHYFLPISFKVFPLGSLFTQNGWISTSIFCMRETGGSHLPWMRDSKSQRLICQGGRAYMLPLWGRNTANWGTISSLRQHSSQNMVNASICHQELLLHAKLEFKVVYGISYTYNICRQLSSVLLVERKLLLGAHATPRKYFSIFCKHIYGYVLPSATKKLRLQKGDLTRMERACLSYFSSRLCLNVCMEIRII